MANALDDIPWADPEAAPPAAVVGAPVPGQKKSYEPAPTAGGDALDNIPWADPEAPPDRPDSETHPLLGQEPGSPHRGEADAFWRHVVSELPIVGGGIKKIGEARATSRRQSLTGLPRSGAEAEVEAEREATDRAHPGYATAGDVVGSVGGLTALAAKVPALFGLASKVGYKIPAVVGAASNAAITWFDDWSHGRPMDPTKLGLSAAGGALGSLFATGLNRVFDTALKPGLSDLYKAAREEFGIKLGAGKISANPLYGKVDDALLAPGEKLFPAVQAAKRGEAGALDDWHRAITATIGEPKAPRLTAKLIEVANKRIGDRIAEIRKALLTAPDKDALRAELAQLSEQNDNIRILQSVTKVDRYGRFSTKEFHEAVVKAIDEDAAATGGLTYEQNGGGKLAKLADIGAAFLKPAVDNRLDWKVALKLLKQGLYSAGPAGAYHLLQHGLAMPDVTTAGMATLPVAAVKAAANFIGTHIAGAAARSPRLGNALVSQSLPIRLIPPAVGIAKPPISGLIQQSVPSTRDYLKAPQP